MLFFPENPELVFLYLHSLRLHEAEQLRRGREMRATQSGLPAKVRLAFENCLVCSKGFGSKPQPGDSAAIIGAELGKLPCCASQGPDRQFIHLSLHWERRPK
jgi:hypothetical protein